MPPEDMLVAVVLPCLNEASSVEATCRSLGFGSGRPADPGAMLIVVDNGSTDETPRLIRHIAANASPNSVFILEEHERGYVPPRRRGVRAAHAIAKQRGVPDDDLLIVQVDADTIYRPGYVRELAAAAKVSGRGVLLEGERQTPADFLQAHPGFVALSMQADDEVAALFVDPEDDVIVDDKASAYWLSDYLAWGGLTREYAANGDELYAETTRLYISGRRSGARRLHVAEAIALPSRRKIFADPVLHFVTAGFPREHSWIKRWHASYQGPNSLEIFEHAAARTLLSQAVAIRQAHSVALFSTLPRIVNCLRAIELVPGGCPPMTGPTTAKLFESAFDGID